jgi:hypothetical protein
VYVNRHFCWHPSKAKLFGEYQGEVRGEEEGEGEEGDARIVVEGLEEEERQGGSGHGEQGGGGARMGVGHLDIVNNGEEGLQEDVAIEMI